MDAKWRKRGRNGKIKNNADLVWLTCSEASWPRLRSSTSWRWRRGQRCPASQLSKAFQNRSGRSRSPRARAARTWCRGSLCGHALARRWSSCCPGSIKSQFSVTGLNIYFFNIWPFRKIKEYLQWEVQNVLSTKLTLRMLPKTFNNFTKMVKFRQINSYWKSFCCLWQSWSCSGVNVMNKF